MAKPKRLGEKRYMIVYDVPPTNGRDRQQRREILRYVTKQEAEAALAARIEAVRKGEYALDPHMTMSTLFDKFMAAKRSRLAATTIDRYESLIKKYLGPQLGAVEVISMRKAHLLDAYGKWEGQNSRASRAQTIHHAHDLLRAVLNWAMSLDYVSTNVAKKMTSEDLPRTRKPDNVVLSERELRLLLVQARNPTKRAKSRGTISAQPWFYAAVALSAYTGARRGEVLALRWSDLDLEAGTATVRSSLAQPKSGLMFKEPKNGKTRTIMIGAELVTILRAHRTRQLQERLLLGEAYGDRDLVIARADGTAVPPWNFGAAFKDLVSRSKVTPITLHDLRDTHASLLAKAGVPIEVISQRLGHSGIGITVDRYLTVYTDRDAAAARAFDRLVG